MNGKAPAPGGAVEIVKEMAVTWADLERGLEAALGTNGFRIEGRTVILLEGRKRLEIDPGEERTRKIALLEVPAMTVRLRLAGYTPAEADDALRRFERAYQKGGG